MSSSDLKDLAFLYPDANGSGTFNGTLKGQITKPVLEGEFTLNDHTYRQWTIQEAGGGVRLDLAAENASPPKRECQTGKLRNHGDRYECVFRLTGRPPCSIEPGRGTGHSTVTSRSSIEKSAAYSQEMSESAASLRLCALRATSALKT